MRHILSHTCPLLADFAIYLVYIDKISSTKHRVFDLIVCSPKAPHHPAGDLLANAILIDWTRAVMGGSVVHRGEYL